MATSPSNVSHGSREWTPDGESEDDGVEDLFQELSEESMQSLISREARGAP